MTKPPFVLHVNNVSNVPRTLVETLPSLGLRAELFQPSIGTWTASGRQRLGLIVRRPRESLELRRTVIHDDVDFLHIHFASFAWMGLVARRPIIAHCHGSDLFNGPAFHGALSRLTLPFVRGAIYSTPNLKRHVTRWQKDAVFLPNPVSTSLFVPGDAERDIDVFVASKLDYTKGIPTAIKGIAMLARTRPTLRVAMLDFGNHQRQLRRVADRVLGRHLVWFGRQAPEQLVLLYRRSRVVLGQLKSGALGLTELEAMACGRPVVANWQHDWAYSSPAPLLCAANAADVARAVETLLDDTITAGDLGSQARKWVVAYHSPDQVARQLIEEYRRWDLV